MASFDVCNLFNVQSGQVFVALVQVEEIFQNPTVSFQAHVFLEMHIAVTSVFSVVRRSPLAIIIGKGRKEPTDEW